MEASSSDEDNEDDPANEDNEDDPALFEDLFGEASDASASHPSKAEAAPTKPRPPASPAKAAAQALTIGSLKKAMNAVFEGGLDLASTTLGQVRALLETNLGLEAGALEELRDVVKNLLSEKINEMQGVEDDGSDEESQDEEMDMQEDADDIKTWPLQKLRDTLENLGMEGDGDRATLIERLGPMQASAAPVGPIEYWEVVNKKVAVREAKDKASSALAGKRMGAIVHARRQDDWLALANEPGFMLISVGEQVLLQKKDEADISIESYEVVYKKVAVRAAKDKSSDALGAKTKGEEVRGRREDDWLVLTDEPGFMLIAVGDQALLQTAKEKAESAVKLCSETGRK